MSVSWTPADGQVDSYTVLLYRDGHLVGNGTDLSNTTKSKQFQQLTPGVRYCVKVVTKSGPFESSDGCVYNATCELHRHCDLFVFIVFEAINNETLFLLLFSSQPSRPHHGGLSDCGVHQLHLVLSREHGP